MNYLNSLLIISISIALISCQPTVAPIVGIVTIPSDYPQYSADSWSYFATSYVKYLESAGAQVIPIQYDLPQSNITFLLDNINGVLFTGGSAALTDLDGDFTPFGAALNFIVAYVVEKNNNGTFYPLWGTCMGFQAIAGLLAGTFSILTGDCVNCHGVNKNNFFNSDYESRLFGGLPDDLREKITNANLTTFVHRYMYHSAAFENQFPLNTFLIPTTFAYDDTGAEYISSYESPSLPIFGTQFHSEKSTFEWRAPYIINHSLDSIRLQQYLSNFFVNQTRQNSNTFANQTQYLIDNYELTIVPDDTFSSVYLFPAVGKAIASKTKSLTPGLFISGR